MRCLADLVLFWQAETLPTAVIRTVSPADGEPGVATLAVTYAGTRAGVLLGGRVDAAVTDLTCRPGAPAWSAKPTRQVLEVELDGRPRRILVEPVMLIPELWWMLLRERLDAVLASPLDIDSGGALVFTAQGLQYGQPVPAVTDALFGTAQRMLAAHRDSRLEVATSAGRFLLEASVVRSPSTSRGDPPVEYPRTGRGDWSSDRA